MEEKFDEFDITAGITKPEVEYDFSSLLMVILETMVLRLVNKVEDLEDRIENIEEALLWNE